MLFTRSSNGVLGVIGSNFNVVVTLDSGVCGSDLLIMGNAFTGDVRSGVFSLSARVSRFTLLKALAKMISHELIVRIIYK